MTNEARHCSLCGEWRILGHSFSIASSRPHSFVCEDCLAQAVTEHETKAVRIVFWDKPAEVTNAV